MPNKKQKTDTGMQQRLKDQLKVFKKIKEIHTQPRLLKEIAFYPAHDKRKETPAYRAAHKELVHNKDLPCIACGVRNSIVEDPVKCKDPKLNPYGAKQLETHHRIIEWSLANAISVDRFNNQLLPHLRHAHPNKPEYKKKFTEKDIKDWVDHHTDNLWVLCDVHHRAKYLGIHEITYPIWGPQDLLRDDFEKYVRDSLAAIKGKGKNGTK